MANNGFQATVYTVKVCSALNCRYQAFLRRICHQPAAWANSHLVGCLLCLTEHDDLATNPSQAVVYTARFVAPRAGDIGCFSGVYAINKLARNVIGMPFSVAWPIGHRWNFPFFIEDPSKLGEEIVSHSYRVTRKPIRHTPPRANLETDFFSATGEVQTPSDASMERPRRPLSKTAIFVFVRPTNKADFGENRLENWSQGLGGCVIYIYSCFQ